MAAAKWKKDDKDDEEEECRRKKNQATFKCAPPLFYFKNAKHLLGFALLWPASCFCSCFLPRTFSLLLRGFVLLLALSFNLFYIAASFFCATTNAKPKPNAIAKKMETKDLAWGRLDSPSPIRFSLGNIWKKDIVKWSGYITGRGRSTGTFNKLLLSNFMKFNQSFDWEYLPKSKIL